MGVNGRAGSGVGGVGWGEWYLQLINHILLGVHGGRQRLNESSSQHLGVMTLENILIVQVLEDGDNIVQAVIQFAFGHALHVLTQEQVAVTSYLIAGEGG